MNTAHFRSDTWLDAVLKGCCVIRFTSETVPDSILEKILKAGCQTRTDSHLQPWQFVVVRSQEGRARVLEHCPEPGPAAGAPVLLAALGNPSGWKQAPEQLADLVRSGCVRPEHEGAHLERIRQRWSSSDRIGQRLHAQTYAAAQQLSVAALASGLSCHWIPEFQSEPLKRLLHVPEDFLLVALLALGYCAQCIHPPVPSLRRKVFSEAYGLPWSPRSEGGGAQEADTKSQEILALLVQEHQCLRGRLQRWEAALDAVAQGGQESDRQAPSLLLEIGRYFEHEMPQHFRQEEGVLYATAQERVPRLQRLVRALRQEHDLIRRALEQFHQKQLHFNNTGQLNDLPRLCRELIAYLRYHLDHEERELLPGIQREFTEADWSELRRLHLASEVA